MPVYMTSETFEINPYMHAGSAIGNAYFSGLNLEEVFSCVRLAETVEGFDEAVSATIKLKEMKMSIEPTCSYCNASDKGRCKTQEEASSCLMYYNRTGALKSIRPNKRPVSQVQFTTKSADEGIPGYIVSSHIDGNADFLSIGQGEDTVVLTTADVDTLIDTLNSVLHHLQQGTRK
jgi:hypothetical protein